MPRLVINPGTPHQWAKDLKAGLNTVGRSPTCDIQVDHSSVSGTHCELTVQGDSVILRDLGSTNGTFLDRTFVQQATLSAGQRLQLGNIEMELLPDGGTSPAAVPTVATAVVSGGASTAGISVSAKPSGPASGIRLSLAGTTASHGHPPAAPTSASAASASASASPAAPPSTTPPAAPPRVNLRVTTHDTTPPPPETPDAYIPEEYTEEAGPAAMCKYHPATMARFLCTKCQLHYCELCVVTHAGGSHTGKFCRRCSGECQALNVQLVRPGTDKENFFATLPGAFAYPFRGSGVTFLVCGTLFFAFVDLLSSFPVMRFGFFNFGLYLKMIYTAYTFAYVQKVIQTAAQGTDEPAGWPDVSDFIGDILVPCLQLIGLALVSFGPAVALAAFTVGLEATASGSVGFEEVIWVIVVAALGCIYYPMAFLALAMYDSVAALNPLLVIPAIMRVPLEYLTVLAVLAVFCLVRIGQSLAMKYLGIPILPTLIGAGIGLYLLTVQGRMLGLLYFSKRERLGWFHSR